MLDDLLDLFSNWAFAWDAPIIPNLICSEGWMLRLLLDWFDKHPTPGSPLSFSPGTRWFSEVLLPTQFGRDIAGAPRKPERNTHPDGVIGHAGIRQGTRRGLELHGGGSQLVVIEAKMVSPLSPGIKHAPSFDQAARTVACMVELLTRAMMSPQQVDPLAFYVVAPDARIQAGVFSTQMDASHVCAGVQERVQQYLDPQKSVWFTQSFAPALQRIRIDCVSWESLLHEVQVADPHYYQKLKHFYDLCLHFA